MMDDAMIDLAGTDPVLARRLASYGDLRLSPSLAATSRMRARVLAVAHRQADLSRTDAGLAVLSAGSPAPVAPAPRLRIRQSVPYRRIASAMLAASLGVAMVAGASFAAEPAGPLYGARLWLEAVTLPSDPGERALAEGRRLQSRLAEAAAASGAADPARAAAALAAYESILAEASAAAVASGDPIAAAALEAAVARNITVLEALAAALPDRASQAVAEALERAIERSDRAIDSIDASNGGNGGNGGSGGNGGNGGQPAGPDPVDEPTKEPKPTKEPTPEPEPTPTPKPTPERPDRPDRPDPTPRKAPPGQAD